MLREWAQRLMQAAEQLGQNSLTAAGSGESVGGPQNTAGPACSILAIFPSQEHVDKSVRLSGFQQAKCASFHKRENHPYTKRSWLEKATIFHAMVIQLKSTT